MKPVTGMAAGYSRQEVQVIIDHGRVQGHRSHIDQLCARQTEQHQEAKHPLLVVDDAFDLGQLSLVETHRRHHDHRSRSLGIGEDVAIDRGETLLKSSEGFVLFPASGRR